MTQGLTDCPQSLLSALRFWSEPSNDNRRLTEPRPGILIPISRREAERNCSNMYAVIRTGGKQYRVAKDDVITVERLPGDEGSEVTLDQVLMLSGEGSTSSHGIASLPSR